MHDPYEKSYGLLPDAYTDKGVTENKGTYFYTIELDKAKYIAQFDQDIAQLCRTFEIQHACCFLHFLLDILQHLCLVLLRHFIFLLHVSRCHFFCFLAADHIMDRLDNGLRRNAVLFIECHLDLTASCSFIKRFAELMLLPRIKNEAQRARAKDELPQSAAGRTIMTTEPKFIPEKAVSIDLKAGGSFRARLIDCVGYMVDGALGHEENNAPRLVKSPWFDQAVPFDQAAETGTRRVIREHATIGLVVTCLLYTSPSPRD